MRGFSSNVAEVFANSGRFTVTLDAGVSADALRAARLERAVAKQLKRGGLAAGAERVVTVIAVLDDEGNECTALSSASPRSSVSDAL